jgi:hypothetical protein
MQLLLLAAQEASGMGEGQLVEAFKHNPTFMVLNLCASAVVLTIVVERFTFQLTRYRVNSKEFFAQIKKLVTAGNIDRAIKLCEASDYPILQLVPRRSTFPSHQPRAAGPMMFPVEPLIPWRRNSLCRIAPKCSPMIEAVVTEIDKTPNPKQKAPTSTMVYD